MTLVVPLSLYYFVTVLFGDSSLVECCGNTSALGVLVTFCRECCGNTAAVGIVVTFCRECCGNTAAVGLDVLVAGVVVEDDVGHRDSKWV